MLPIYSKVECGGGEDAEAAGHRAGAQTWGRDPDGHSPDDAEAAGHRAGAQTWGRDSDGHSPLRTLRQLPTRQRAQTDRGHELCEHSVLPQRQSLPEEQKGHWPWGSEGED